MELSKLQNEIVHTNKEKVVVIAAAGSGKTAVLTERVKYLLEQGAEPSHMVIITFTNAAAEEMSKRVDTNGAFLGTIHSYANYLLKSAGYKTESCIDSEDFDLLFAMVKEHLDCIRIVDNLLLDEAQDSSALQFEFLLQTIKPKSFFLVADCRQSIYEFNGARPDILRDLADRTDITTYDLNENYRNGYTILNFARSLIQKLGDDYEDDSISMNGQLGKVLKVDYSLPAVLSCIQKFGEPKDWFVLTRTNAQLESIYSYLIKNGIPCDTFKRAALSNEDFEKKMRENTVKVLTVHTSKGLEANNVIVVGTNSYNDEEVRISYVAATRAKELLIWTKKPKAIKRKSAWGWS